MHVMHRFFTSACAVATAGVALGTWGVTAASASAGGRVTVHHDASIVAGRGGALQLTRNGPTIGLSVNAPARSRDFAGYVAPVAAGSATVAAASFTLPTLSCTTANRAILPATLVAMRTTSSAAFMFVGCVNGKARYFPGLVSNGKETDFTAARFAAGNVIDMTTKVSTTRTKVEVTNVTTGVTVKHRGVGARARGVIVGDLVASNGSRRLHVPDFGKLTFKNCLIDGTALGSLHPQAVQMVNSRGTVQISTGGFFPGGTAFTTHFRHS